MFSPKKLLPVSPYYAVPAVTAVQELNTVLALAWIDPYGGCEKATWQKTGQALPPSVLLSGFTLPITLRCSSNHLSIPRGCISKELGWFQSLHPWLKNLVEVG